MKRFYVDGPFGQVHCLEWGSDTRLPPVLCLPPSPYSSKAYLTLAPLLSEKRRVIAVDYPGIGGSDAKNGELGIEDLANVVCAVIEHRSSDRAVDLFGFHSGTLVAIETALHMSNSVNKLVLTDVPFFSPDKQAELMLKTPKVLPISSELSGLKSAWKFCVESKLEHIPLSRAHQIFIDHLSAGDGGNAIFRAAFTYPCAQRFEKVATPTWVIATDSSLYDVSCKTAQLINSATLIELPQVSVAVLEAGAKEIAKCTLNILD